MQFQEKTESGGIEMLTVAEAADILCISRRTVYRLVESQKIPHMKLSGCVRFEKNILEQWIRDEILQGIQKNGSSKKRSAMGSGLQGPRRDRGPEAIPPVVWATRKKQKAS